MKVYQRLAQAFIAEGTTHMFGIMGDGNMSVSYTHLTLPTKA